MQVSATEISDLIRKKIENFEASPLKNILKGLSFSLIFGLIISAIVGLIMKKSDEVIDSI